MSDNARTALVTGASGFIGSRLVPSLLEGGWDVRVLARDPGKLRVHAWHDAVDIVRGSADDDGALRRALDGVDVAYYLIHSMTGSFDYAQQDRDLADAFARVSGEVGVGRNIYLGGLYPADKRLSDHLQSRCEVGQILLNGPVPATVLQAGMVIGAGSASFDMLRAAVRLPVIVGPSWLDNRVQPIAVGDAVHYLVSSASLPSDVNRAFDIGCPEAITYRELIGIFAQVAGRRPPSIVAVPMLLPRTASLWAGMLSPGPTALNAALVHSLTLEMVCGEHDIDEYVDEPNGGRQGVAAAIASALAAAA